ncbi:LysR family transcriptional regulator [Bradyrhizobium sp. WSM3983]|uniref:LysR family transcriptional regulator n=1 Tax=Bradyrhizobium sp. WSM3983 TaxID=1038867 RepID=UPI0009FC80D2
MGRPSQANPALPLVTPAYKIFPALLNGSETTVAELGNFTAAASRLNVAQSALSRQIGNLEAELGVSLFLRTGKRIQLAPAECRLRPAVLKLLMDADALRGLPLAEDECIAEDVAIGAHPSDGQFIFPHLTQQMRRLYPGVRVDLDQELTSPLQEHLLRGRWMPPC